MKQLVSSHQGRCAKQLVAEARPTSAPGRAGLWLSLALVLGAFGARAQTVPIDVEAGYRWTDVEGNEDLYRTQINEQDGFLIRSLSFFSGDIDGPGRGIVDHFRLDATDLGSGPASSLRIDAGKAGAYRLRLGYRSFDAFSSLPNFANPFLAQGIVPGQHTWDRTRTMFDADLELLPYGERFTPFIGYSYATFDGPGTTTYFLGGDEFRLDSDLDEKETELRIGSGFNVGPFFGSIAQGWRDVDSTERLVLSQGAGDGNNSFPILDRPINSGGITRLGETDARAPFTNIHVATQPTARIRMVASYVRTNADADSTEVESSTGSFVSFPHSVFFSGLDEGVTSDAENRTWRGDIRFELHATDHIAILAGYRRESRELRGSALIDSLFQDAVDFSGISEGDLQEILNTESSFDRSFDEVEASVNLQPFDGLLFRAGLSRAEYDIEIAPDLEEISVPGNQSGSFARSVDSADLSATYASRLFSLGASWRTDSADAPVVRTDFTERSRVRGRLGFHTPNRMLSFGVSGEQWEQENEADGFGFDADTSAVSFDVDFAPGGMLRLRGALSKLETDSVISIRRPENFELETSEHGEEWDSVEIGFALVGTRATFDASATRMENDGTLPYSSHRYRARATVDLKAHLGLAGEWSRDEFDYDTADWGRFEGNRFGVFVRYRP